MKQKLENEILLIIKNKYNIVVDKLWLREPPKKEIGDFAFNCWVLAKGLKKNPNLIAEEILSDINWIDIIDISVIDGSYINIKLNKNLFSNLFNSIYSDKDNLIWNKEYNNKTIVIDYIWANVWKPMHIWHMCTPNQWQVLINLYKKLWYKVISDSHIWDWGIIFGKLILAYKLWWDENKLKENAVDYLLELYIKITEETEKDELLEQKIRNEFKLLSKGDSDSVKLWKIFTSFSIDAMKTQFDRLNIEYDYDIWESFYEWLNLPKMQNYPDLKWDMHSIVNELIEKWIATQNNDNSVWVEFDKNTKIPSCVLQKRDWTHWYLASDVAWIKYRMDNWNPEKIVYFIDSRQQLHLKQAFTIAKNAWWLDNTELFHAFNWFISLKDGAMSSRKGRIIKLDKLLDEAESRAEKIILEKREDIEWEELKNLSKIIWIWAIKYWYLKKSREIDVIFDWDEFMSFEWNSGPYIQYAYVRSIRILEKANYDTIDTLNNDWKLEFSEEIELIKIIWNYDDILVKVTKTNSPHILCKYTYDLTKAFNSFYNNIHILSEEDENKKIMRLKIVELFWLVLKDSFKILGIDMPDKM